MNRCKSCGRDLLPDEIGLYKKIVNRGATEYLCMTCLADKFECSEELLKRKIEHFRNMGCLLFEVIRVLMHRSLFYERLSGAYIVSTVRPTSQKE